MNILLQKKLMIAIVIELLLSWLLLKYTLGQNLSVLGLRANARRMLLILSGFTLPFAYLSILYLTISLWVQNPYKLNPDYTFSHFLQALIYLIKSVVFEELIFRGALLYVLIHKLNSNKAIALSAMAFGVYHWFSYGILGQAIQMAVVFISTGVMGYLLALAFVRSRTILLPFALHLGYNFTSMILFSNEKNIGLQLMVKTYIIDPVKPEGIFPLIMVIIYYTGFPLLCFIYLKLWRADALD